MTRGEFGISVKEERNSFLETEKSLMKQPVCPNHSKSKCKTFTLFEVYPLLRNLHQDFKMPEAVNTQFPFQLQSKDLSFSIGNLTVPPVLGFYLYLSGCSFPSLYSPLHVSAPLCGCLCASKIDPANGLPNNPGGEQAVSHINHIRKDN